MLYESHRMAIGEPEQKKINLNFVEFCNSHFDEAHEIATLIQTARVTTSFVFQFAILQTFDRSFQHPIGQNASVFPCVPQMLFVLIDGRHILLHQIGLQMCIAEKMQTLLLQLKPIVRRPAQSLDAWTGDNCRQVAPQIALIQTRGQFVPFQNHMNGIRYRIIVFLLRLLGAEHTIEPVERFVVFR